MRYDLAKYAEFLAKERDNYRKLYAEFGDRADYGRANAYEVALNVLWFATGGEFGQRLDEQPGGAS